MKQAGNCHPEGAQHLFTFRKEGVETEVEKVKKEKTSWTDLGD